MITKTTRKLQKRYKNLKVAGRQSTSDSMTDQRELGTPSRTVGPDTRRLPAFKPLTISTYNVRTLYQQGKTHQLFMGCADAGVDIIGIQEHRLITSNPTDELWSDDRNWVLVYGSATPQRQGGVGILMSKHIYKCLQKVEVISERICYATFHGNPQLSITVIYAPTESSSPSAKEDFYTSLTDHLDQVKRHNIHLILGDFNAKVGKDSHATHPVIVGKHCFHDSTNDNGERLINVCQEFNLRLAQPRFPQPHKRLWTWMHPAGSKHQLDHILINGKWVNSLRNCRAYNSIELDSDHRIVSISLVTSLRTSKGKTCKRPKFNWWKLQDQATREEFQLELSNRFQALSSMDDSTDITERYESFETSVREAAEKVVGKRQPCGLPSWVSEETIRLKTVRDEAKKQFMLSKSQEARHRWRGLNTSLNNSYKADEVDALNKQMEELRSADERGDYTATWKIIHTLSGKNTKQNVKVKKQDGSAPSSENELLEEWKDFFSSLLNNDNGLVPSEVPQPTAKDLPIFTDPPTRDETAKAIAAMKTNKAAGLDCAITAEALQGGGDKMLDIIHAFCTEVYTTLSPPDQWISNVIIPLPKKGDLSLMTNYRGISLISIAAKVYNRILLDRIRPHVDPMLRNNQAGFRPGRSCAQQIHILRRIMEGFKEYQLPLIVTFVDFKKAFDSINRLMMFSILRHYGIPKTLVDAIQVLYTNSSSAVMVDGSLSASFNVTTGVLQGDVLAPFLFIILVDYLLGKASEPDTGVMTCPRQSSRYPAKILNDLDFADDIALLESSTTRAQSQLTRTADAAADLGLVISAPKTEFMTINCHPQPLLQVYGNLIKHVTDFKYLGSMMGSSASDMKRRRALAWTAFWKLERLWRSNTIPVATKVKLFNTTCVTVLLYGCESWIMSEDMVNKINSFGTSCYRIMLNIKRTDRVPNATIYSLTETTPLIERVRTKQLKFLGHILRMPHDEPVKEYALYIPTHGKRKRGRPRTLFLKYTQNLLGDMDDMLNKTQITAMAQDRTSWRDLVVACSAADR